MLAVGVDPTAERVVVLERPAVARGDPDRQAAVPPERSTSRRAPARRRRCGRSSRRRRRARPRRELALQIVENGGQVLLLVPRGDEDERVVHAYPPGRAPPVPPAAAGLRPGRCDLPRDRARARWTGASRRRSGSGASNSREKKNRVRWRWSGAQTTTARSIPRSSSSGSVRAAFSAVIGRGRLDDELDGGPLPGRAHLLGLGRSSAGAAGEHDDVDRLVRCEPFGLANELEAGTRDRRRAAAAPTIPEHDDRGSHVPDGTRRNWKQRHAVGTILPGYSDPVAEPRSRLG